MDNLFFRLQENKQFQRQILILQYLNKKDHPSTSKELSNVTKTSSPTLRSDIEALRQILPKEMAITFQKRIGYQLMVPRSPKIETIILDLAKHTPCLSIDRSVFPWTDTLTTISSCHPLLIAITHSKNHQTTEQRTADLSLAMADISYENPRK